MSLGGEADPHSTFRSAAILHRQTSRQTSSDIMPWNSFSADLIADSFAALLCRPPLTSWLFPLTFGLP